MTPRHITNVLSALGAIGLVGLIVGGTLGASAIQRGLSARDQPSWLEGKLARTMRGWAVPRTAKQLVSPTPTSAELLGEARAHWADHCATCHANDGSGNTSMGRNLYPKAPDMRAPGTQGLSDGELYYIIQNGIRLTGMPAWGDAVDDDRDTWALVAWIRHLPNISSEEIQNMTEMNPMSAREWREQQEEKEFLEGSQTQQPPEPMKRRQHR